jgi:hypothetical protein
MPCLSTQSRRAISEIPPAVTEKAVCYLLITCRLLVWTFADVSEERISSSSGIGDEAVQANSKLISKFNINFYIILKYRPTVRYNKGFFILSFRVYISVCIYDLSHVC